MKLPMCYFCLKTGVLCPRCQEKVEKGELSQLDFQVAKILTSLEEKRFPELKQITYHKAYREDNLLVVIVSGTGNTIRPPWNRIARILGDELKLNVRLVEKTSSLKIIAEELIAPGRLLGVNTLWLPDGTEENTVRIPKSDLRRLPAKPEIIERVLGKLTRTNVKLAFE